MGAANNREQLLKSNKVWKQLLTKKKLEVKRAYFGSQKCEASEHNMESRSMGVKEHENSSNGNLLTGAWELLTRSMRSQSANMGVKLLTTGVKEQSANKEAWELLTKSMGSNLLTTEVMEAIC